MNEFKIELLKQLLHGNMITNEIIIDTKSNDKICFYLDCDNNIKWSIQSSDFFNDFKRRRKKPEIHLPNSIYTAKQAKEICKIISNFFKCYNEIMTNEKD